MKQKTRILHLKDSISDSKKPQIFKKGCQLKNEGFFPSHRDFIIIIIIQYSFHEYLSILF